MALTMPLNYDARISWIERHLRDARTAIQGKNQLGFTTEQFTVIANINDALSETLSVLKELVDKNS